MCLRWSRAGCCDLVMAFHVNEWAGGVHLGEWRVGAQEEGEVPGGLGHLHPWCGGGGHAAGVPQLASVLRFHADSTHWPGCLEGAPEHFVGRVSAQAGCSYPPTLAAG